ncbi:MRPS24 [Bugula neritina]|uniref:MRPS24 n=1 Tax=Bugula neritina TaxID=10212 RepID=A0A7J7K6G1_BUGNE|nr:MRPS24 [Bugula neritina]
MLSRYSVSTLPCGCRGLHSSALVFKNIRTGVPKVTNNRSKPLTYEQAQKPGRIGVTKYWNSIDTSALFIEKEYKKWLPRSSEVAVEDVFIRKFISGTFQEYLLGEVIIKRRVNMVNLAFLVKRTPSTRTHYFLKGYTEAMLSKYLKCIVKIEIQTVENPRSLIFKKI